MLDHRKWLPRFLATYPWAILTIFVAMCSGLALLLVRIDQALRISPDTDRLWLYGGSADAAIGVLSAIASSAITVAGVVFSATFVTMQLASSQYSPRVVQALRHRWYLQIVIGLFLGSFAYSLLVLRSVRPPGASGEAEFVPVLSVSVAVILAISAVWVLIFYVVTGLRSLEPTYLINSAASQTVELLQRSLTLSHATQTAEEATSSPMESDDAWTIRADRTGYFQAMQHDRLMSIAIRLNVTIKVTASIGHYRFPGEALALVWPREHLSPGAIDEIQQALLIGIERTPEQDIEYGFRRVADIMLKSLSAAINDPTTAQYCVNTLCHLVILVANEPTPERYLADEDRIIRVIWEPEPFDRCVHTAFDQLRFYAGGDTHLIVHTLDALRRTIDLIPDENQEVVRDVASTLVSTVSTTIISDADRLTVDQAAAWLE